MKNKLKTQLNNFLKFQKNVKKLLDLENYIYIF